MGTSPAPHVWWEPKQYELKTGQWVPKVHLYETVPGGIEASLLMAPENRRFATEGEAREYSIAMARKWIKDKYL